jgi:hypothetical protein
MKTKIAAAILSLLLVFVLLGSVSAQDKPDYSVMRVDLETWIKWQNEYLAAPRARIDERINFMLDRASALGRSTSMDLLDHIDYDPTQRDQGYCGDCWVWAGTGVMEIAHDVQDDVFDRLSIQYVNSCRANGFGFACCGGNLTDFAAWYNDQGLVIPWDNTDAFFDDAGKLCRHGSSDVACASISTTPNYPIDSIQDVTIETHTGQANAIANIKNILNQNKAVYFGFALPDSGAWNDFKGFWRGDDGETEATLWSDIDAYCGDEWVEDEDEAGGHAVVIVGYNDDDADPDNHYWIALNSWGTALGVRPNGLFRVPTQMNYDCVYPDTNNDRSFWAFQFKTLDVDFGDALPVADADGPYDVDCGGTTTTVYLDGSGSSDLEDDPLTFSWSTDCPGGLFDDASSATPMLTVDTSPGCSVACSVSLTVTDDVGGTDTATATVNISDLDAPVITPPADVTIECDESTDPSNTGYATATDTCDADPAVTHSDAITPGDCPQEYLIERAWTATDSCGNSAGHVQTITVVDTAPPTITPPADVTVECDESTAPANTGYATATDGCDANPAVTHSDAITPGDCPQEHVITRTWTATDSCGNSASHVQTITVADTTRPVIRCNAPATITPPDAPISFTATATDNCDGSPSVAITRFECFKFTKNGKKIDKKKSCRVRVSGDSITIRNTGGVGTHIAWNVRAIDSCENVRNRECEVVIVRPGRR